MKAYPAKRKLDFSQGASWAIPQMWAMLSVTPCHELWLAGSFLNILTDNIRSGYQIILIYFILREVYENSSFLLSIAIMSLSECESDRNEPALVLHLFNRITSEDIINQDMHFWRSFLLFHIFVNFNVDDDDCSCILKEGDDCLGFTKYPHFFQVCKCFIFLVSNGKSDKERLEKLFLNVFTCQFGSMSVNIQCQPVTSFWIYPLWTPVTPNNLCLCTVGLCVYTHPKTSPTAVCLLALLHLRRSQSKWKSLRSLTLCVIQWSMKRMWTKTYTLTHTPSYIYTWLKTQSN